MYAAVHFQLKNIEQTENGPKKYIFNFHMSWARMNGNDAQNCGELKEPENSREMWRSERALAICTEVKRSALFAAPTFYGEKFKSNKFLFTATATKKTRRKLIRKCFISFRFCPSIGNANKLCSIYDCSALIKWCCVIRPPVPLPPSWLPQHLHRTRCNCDANHFFSLTLFGSGSGSFDVSVLCFVFVFLLLQTLWIKTFALFTLIVKAFAKSLYCVQMIFPLFSFRYFAIRVILSCFFSVLLQKPNKKQNYQISLKLVLSSV